MRRRRPVASYWRCPDTLGVGLTSDALDGGFLTVAAHLAGMPDLSACYFCGAAADAQVREYDVVPDAIDETLQSTATLCPGCRKKLESVLSTVARGASPTDEPVDVALGAGGDDAETAARSTSADGDPLDLDSEDLFDPDQPVDDAAADDPGRGSAGRSSGAAAGGDGIALGADEEPATGGTAPTEESAEASTERATSPGNDEEQSAVDAGPTGSDARRAADSGLSGNDASAPASGGASGTDTAAGSGADAGGAGEQAAADADVERPDAQTYNKIIRLLQNREFPVNRSKFSELATSAYDVTPDECARVIDYAIHRGELREDRGMLKKP